MDESMEVESSKPSEVIKVLRLGFIKHQSGSLL